MTHAVLFVCSMNVCRSPLMHQTFIEGLPTADRSIFDVSSRGVNANRGNHVCTESAILMQGTDQGQAFARTHGSSPLSPSDLTSPDLVIVATRAERAMLARYAPALRPLTFTLREANLLGAAPTSPSEQTSIARAVDTHEAPLTLNGFPHLLHRRRGSMALPQPKTWGRNRTDPLDIPDAHLGRPTAHGTMLRALRDETKDLLSRMMDFCEHDYAS